MSISENDNADHSADLFQSDTQSLKAIFDNMPDGCVVVNSSGLIVKVNQEALEMFGYEESQLIGKPVEILMPGTSGSEHVKHRMAFYKNPVKRQMGRRGIDLFGIRSDESVFPVDICLSPTKIKDELYVLTIIRDITETFTLRKELYETNEKWTSMIAYSNDIFGVLDLDGRITSVNRMPKKGTTLLGTSTNIIGKKAADLMPAKSAESFTAELESVRKKKKLGWCELKTKTNSWFEISIVPLMREGIITGFITIGKDVTERKISERLIQEAQIEKIKAIIQSQEKERARISHDLHDGLGQVLASINMYVAALEELDFTKSETGLNLFENLKQLSQRAVKECRLISHNLLPKHLQDFGIEKALDEMVKSIPTLENGIKITKNISENLVDKRFSSELEITIYRIMQEIINNTIRHAKATKLTIDILYRENEIVITTLDNGSGFNYEESRNRNGIGLSSITERVDALNGKIQFDSQIGRGTHILVTLPVILS